MLYGIPRMNAMETPTLDSPPANCRQIRLQDNRLLAYAEYGDPKGKPVMLFHGTPGSRLFHHPDESVALSLRARVIMPDRPGFGLSDFKAGRTLTDWPDDVLQLADALKIDRFAVAGISGGGPYVIACALKIPHRLTRAALISSMAPLSVPGAAEGMMWRNSLLFNLAHNSRVFARFSWWGMNLAFNQNPKRFFKFEAGLSSQSEKQLMGRPEIESILIRDYAEALRTGIEGVAWETILLARPWDLRLEDIVIETHLWHGQQDTRTPMAMGRYLASTIPNCRATFVAAEGHDVFYHHWGEILSVLTPPEVIEDISRDTKVESLKKPRRRVMRRALASDTETTTTPAEPRPARRRVTPRSERPARTRKQLTGAGATRSSTS